MSLFVLGLFVFTNYYCNMIKTELVAGDDSLLIKNLGDVVETQKKVYVFEIDSMWKNVRNSKHSLVAKLGRKIEQCGDNCTFSFGDISSRNKLTQIPRGNAILGSNSNWKLMDAKMLFQAKANLSAKYLSFTSTEFETRKAFIYSRHVPKSLRKKLDKGWRRLFESHVYIGATAAIQHKLGGRNTKNLEQIFVSNAMEEQHVSGPMQLVNVSSLFYILLASVGIAFIALAFEYALPFNKLFK